MSSFSPTPVSEASQLPTGDVSTSLVARLDRLGRLVRRLVVVEMIAVLVISIVLTISAAALVDWWWRPSSWVGRWAITGMLLVGAGGAVLWCGAGLTRRRVTTAAIARRIETIWPQLGDRLSSALAIGQPSTGRRETASAELAQEAVRQAAAELDAVAPERSVDRGPALRTALVALASLAVLLSAMFWSPETSRTAARRLFSPAAAARWPQRDRLLLENVPQRVHAGEDVEIFVRNAPGELPEDTEIQFRIAEGRVITPPLRMSGTSGAAVLDRIAGDFEVRARGGDDDTMPWMPVEVLAAPRLVEFSARLTPPEYAGRPPVETVETTFSALSDTLLELRAVVDPPVQSAEWVAELEPAELEDSQASGEQSQPPPVTRWKAAVSDAGNTITVGPIPLRSSGQYALAWIDRNGLAGQSETRWRITIEEDQTPRVQLAEPQEDLEITLAAEIPLEGRGTDDLGLAESWFEVRHVQSARVARIAVRAYEDAPLDQTFRSRWAAANGDAGDDQAAKAEGVRDEAAQDEEGAEAQPPAAGDSVEITAVAIDTAGQRGQSTTRRLRIVSKDALLAILARAQRDALEAVREAAEQQRIALEQTAAAKNRLGEDEEQRRAAQNRLQTAEAAQRMVQRRIAGEPDSFRSTLQRAIEAAHRNHVDPEPLESLQRRIDETIAGQIARAEETLQAGSQQLATADLKSASESLTSAAENQQGALDGLEALVADMRLGDLRRGLAEQLGEVEAAQQRLADAARQSTDAADPQRERARLANDQRELARDTEMLSRRLREMAEQVQIKQPTVAEQARAAAQTLDQGDSQGVAETMRRASEELSRGRTGRAEQWQRDAGEQLALARQQFDGQPPRQAMQTPDGAPGRTSLAGDLQRLTGEQESVVADLRSPAPGADSRQIADRQAQIATETRQTASLPGLPPGFQDALSDTAADMDRGTALLRRNSPAEALASATAALERLQFITSSLTSAAAAGGAGEEAGNPAAGEQDSGDDSQIPLASLKLVRATQDFLRRRTAVLAQVESVAANNTTAEGAVARARLQAAKQTLAQEQQRLVERIAAYAAQMSTPPPKAPSDKPPSDNSPSAEAP